MPMTKKRRDQLRSQCGDGSFDDSYGFHGGEGEGLSCSELRELLDGAEERDELVGELLAEQWRREQYPDAYNRGVYDCAGKVIRRLTPLPQGEPEG